MSNERRLRKRVNLSVYLGVFDANTKMLMGRVIDINPAGILLLTEREYANGSEFSVNIQLPESILGQSVINCLIKVCHTEVCANESFNEVGLDVIYTSIESKKIIEKVQDKWCLKFPE